MDLTPSIPTSMPADVTAGSQTPEPAIPLSSATEFSNAGYSDTASSDTQLQTVIQRVLHESERSTGRAVRPEELLLHLLCESEGLGLEALQAAGVKPQRVRSELLRLMGHADDAARLTVERAPWPLSRWAWIGVVLSSIAYPLSIGPVMIVVGQFGMESSTEAAMEIVYFPIIWLYEALPMVKTFYDWYLKVIGYS